LAILKEVEALNVQRVRLGLQPVQVRIGVETGVALVGDLGTPFRSTYTAVGDCINFASRLETAARDLPTQMVIGSATQRQLLKHQTRSMGFITLRGTTAHIEVFCVNQKEAKA
jgi:adenylate cyclase